MKDKDTRQIWEAFLPPVQGEEDDSVARGSEAFDTSTPQGVAYWIVDTVKAYQDGGMDDETREDFQTEVYEIMTQGGIDPIQTIEFLDASRENEDDIPRPHSWDELDIIDKFIEDNVAPQWGN